MARAGLGAGWECVFANDFCEMKASVYRNNWGDDMVCADVNSLKSHDLPCYADMAWASFPCQDLSLAGNIRGLGTEDAQTRSGAFWAFWRIMQQLATEGRAPGLIVLENVYGILTSNGGRDFALICRCLALADYSFGAVMIDAVHFVPQSRPRVFIIAVRGDLTIPNHIISQERMPDWHPRAMESAIDRLCESDRRRWIWLDPGHPDTVCADLAELIDTDPEGVEWNSDVATDRLISMMSAPSLKRLDVMLRAGEKRVGTIYKRGRPDETGRKRQRAELRADQIAGCLRTPGGGSSRQTVLVTESGCVRSRLLAPREAARLMGLPDSYRLPTRYNDAYKVAGDGVVVPVVRHLAAKVLEPLLAANSKSLLMAAE